MQQETVNHLKKGKERRKEGKKERRKEGKKERGKGRKEVRSECFLNDFRFTPARERACARARTNTRMHQAGSDSFHSRTRRRM